MEFFKARMRSTMPVRSLNSSVLKWPDRLAVDNAAREWAASEAKRHPGLLKLGYFGSYARGDSGVGSDLDIIAIVDLTNYPFERRALKCELNPLPVPAEILVYTLAEFNELISQQGRFAQMLQSEVKWIYTREGQYGEEGHLGEHIEVLELIRNEIRIIN